MALKDWSVWFCIGMLAVSAYIVIGIELVS